MIQNQFEHTTRNQSFLFDTEAILKTEAQRADRQVPWALATLLQGELVLPGDDDYAEARTVWNGAIDRHPALIVRCLDTSDVITAITFARQQHLVVSVRSGGHSIAGFGTNDGGIVIDLSRMKGILIDPPTRTVRVQPGLTLGEFVHETQVYGLATTTGTVSGTGIGGLTLGGGIGWLMGKYGLTIDSLLSVDLVIADGQVLTASATEHPDLFWGLRGGGGNFGVATSFTFQLHPVSSVLAGKIVYPLSQAKDVLRFYRKYTRTAPDELTTYAAITTTSHDLPTIVISLCYCGSLTQGEQLIEPLRRYTTPLADFIHVKPYLHAISPDAGAPNGQCYYEKACSLHELGDDVIDLIADYSAACTSPYSQVLIQHVHGAARRVNPTATAFALREVPYIMNIVAEWPDDDAQEAGRHMEWVSAFQAALLPFTLKGVYTNFLGDEGEEQVRASYGVNYERLAALKNAYDPKNVFRFNQNIKPTISLN